MGDQVRFDEKLKCDSCGRFGAFDFGNERLCGDCYEARGSCCPEFGERDAWKIEPESKKEGREEDGRASGPKPT